MTDNHAPPASAESDPSRERARIEPDASGRSTDLLPGLYLLGLVVLAVAMYFLWTNPPQRSLAPEEANKVNTLDAQIATLQQQVAALQSQKPPPAPSTAELAKLQQQVTDLANRPPPQQASLAPIEQRLAALEARQAATPDQVSQLSAQVIQLANKVPDVQPLTQRVGTIDSSLLQIGTQLQTLSGKIDEADKTIAQTQRDATGQNDALKGSLATLQTQVQQASQAQTTLSARVDQLDQQSKQTLAQVQQVAQKAQLAAQLQGVAAKLAAGQKLGTIPNAPPALARFADQNPPTEPALRASFDTYAQKAAQASQPQDQGGSFGARMLARAQQSVTVRQGDHVLVGDPIAGVIAQARDQLDDGDLAATVGTLKGLPGPAMAAMQPWIDQAQSLLDARAAIATMAAG